MKTAALVFIYLFFFFLHVWRDWMGRYTVSIFRSEQLRTDWLLPAVVTQVHDISSHVRINDCTPQPSAAVTAHSDFSHTAHLASLFKQVDNSAVLILEGSCDLRSVLELTQGCFLHPVYLTHRAGFPFLM